MTTETTEHTKDNLIKYAQQIAFDILVQHARCQAIPQAVVAEGLLLYDKPHYRLS